MRKKVEVAADYGKSIAETVFAEFRDRPDFRGPDFTWDWLVGHVAQTARFQVWANLYWKNRTEKLMKRCQDVASAAAMEKMRELIKDNS